MQANHFFEKKKKMFEHDLEDYDHIRVARVIMIRKVMFNAAKRHCMQYLINCKRSPAKQTNDGVWRYNRILITFLFSSINTQYLNNNNANICGAPYNPFSPLIQLVITLMWCTHDTTTETQMTLGFGAHRTLYRTHSALDRCTQDTKSIDTRDTRYCLSVDYWQTDY